jgi:DNA polymerase-1
MPDTLRGCIISEQGYTFINLDASQIELRVLAILSQDPQMLEDLKTGDLHMATATRIFGWTDDEEEMKSKRYKAKQANFAMVYGADEYKLAEMLECSTEEAKTFMEEHKKAYPALYAWMAEQVKQAKETGFVINMFGRIRPLPELEAGSWRIREKAEREVVNTIVQGSAVDIVKLAGLYLRKMLDSRVKYLLQVHDEWLLECPNELLESSLAVCKTLPDVFPDYPFSIKVGTIYNQLKEVE